MKLVVSGARLRCTMGSAPANLAVLPKARVEGTDQPVGDILTNLPQVNVPPFAMCRSMSNPQVAAATAAANGVLTPQPCIPVLPAPWSPGASSVEIDGVTALTDDSTLDCAYAGKISIDDPGQSDAEVEG